MINLDKLGVELDCPKCDFQNTITIKQVRINDVIICRGCKRNIKLEDYMRTTQKVVRSVNRSLRELEQQLGG